MVIYLIVINMPYFDMIFDMNFLSKYGVEIDYRKKKVRFTLDDGKEFTFGEGQVLNMIINSVKIEKILSKWCITYLEHIVNKSNETVLGVRDT